MRREKTVVKIGLAVIGAICLTVLCAVIAIKLPRMKFHMLKFGVRSANAAKLPAKGQKTNQDKFEIKAGKVVITGRSDIGKILEMGTVEVDCIEITDMKIGQRELGLVIKVKGTGKYDTADSTFIEYDQIDGLLSGIGYVARVSKSCTKLNRFEAEYQTESELSIVTFNNEKGETSAVVRTGSIGGSHAFVSLGKLAELRNIIAKAKEKLDEIK